MNADKIFQLIRLPNLLLLILLQLLLRAALAVPVMEAEGRPLILSTEEFLLLVIACTLVAAGGYIINDIEDQLTDKINKPEKVIVGRYISTNNAYTLYTLFTGTGVLTGFYLSYFAKIQYAGTIIAVTAGMLYFYATTYKCIPLLGNLIVSLIMAFSVLIIAFPEPLILSHPQLFSLFTGYAVFAFLFTLVRELIKDLEDKNGDSAADCRTLVIAAGEKKVKVLTAVILILTLTLLVMMQIVSKQWEDIIPFMYVTAAIVLPGVYLVFRIVKSHTKEQYRFCSNLSKFIMFAGVCSLLIFYFTLRLT